MIAFLVGLALASGSVMMNEMISAIGVEQRAAGESVQAAATDDQIAGLRKALDEQFAATLPDAYALLLRTADGIDFNGLVLYGSAQTSEKPGPGGFWQGMVEANTLWREGGAMDFLVLGETDMDLLTVGLDGRTAAIRDKVSHDVTEEFASVETMLSDVVARRM